MDIWIDIEPGEEQIEIVLKKYAAKESLLPKNPRRYFYSIGYILVFIVTVLPALVIVLLRIPFIIIRKLRVFYLKGAHKRYYENLYSWDPDMEGRDIPPFIDPLYKKASKAKKEDELGPTIEEVILELKNKYLADRSLVNTLIDYAVLVGLNDYRNGNRVALYILDQLYEDKNAAVNKGVLYRNIGVICHRLKLPNHHYFFLKLAKENNGFQKNEKMAFMSLISDNRLAKEAWSYLARDVYFCWPK